MHKVQNRENSSETIRKIERMILENLLTRFNQQTPPTGDEGLRHSLYEASKSSFFDAALENLIEEGFVSHTGNIGFQLTPNGIKKIQKAKRRNLMLDCKLNVFTITDDSVLMSLASNIIAINLIY